MRLRIPLFFALLTVLFACNQDRTGELTPALRISENSRYLATENGDPFFWLGDNGWLLFKKLSREGGAAPAVVKHGLGRILVEMGYQSARFNIEIGVNPYLTCLGCKI